MERGTWNVPPQETEPTAVLLLTLANLLLDPLLLEESAVPVRSTFANFPVNRVTVVHTVTVGGSMPRLEIVKNLFTLDVKVMQIISILMDLVKTIAVMPEVNHNVSKVRH